LITPYLPPVANGEEPSKIEVRETNAIESKAEASPPKNNKLILVAVSLAAIHYVLERIFQASMNPFVTIIQYAIPDNKSDFPVGTILGQFAGLFLAGLYVRLCKPSKETIEKLIQEELQHQKKN